MESTSPGIAIAQFSGDLLVLYGDQDTVVTPDISTTVINKATQASSVRKYVVAGADHGLGLFSDESDKSEQAVMQSILFFVEYL